MALAIEKAMRVKTAVRLVPTTRRRRKKRQKKMSAMNQLVWDTSTTSPQSSPVRSATYTAKVKSSRT